MTLSMSPNFLPQFTHPYYGGDNCAHLLELIDAQCFNTVNVQYRLTIAYCVNVIVVISILIEKKFWNLNKNRKWNDWNVNGVGTSPSWVTCWCAKGTQSQRTIMVSISGIFIFYLKILEEIIFLLKHLHIQWDWMQHFAWFFNKKNTSLQRLLGYLWLWGEGWVLHLFPSAAFCFLLLWWKCLQIPDHTQ